VEFDNYQADGSAQTGSMAADYAHSDTTETQPRLDYPPYRSSILLRRPLPHYIDADERGGVSILKLPFIWRCAELRRTTASHVVSSAFRLIFAERAKQSRPSSARGY
jgi:hypothetical protein